MIFFFLLAANLINSASEKRPRMRELGIVTGIFKTGNYNAITDVAGVKVGHFTLIEGDDIRTGVTVIIPHEGNIFQEKVPAAVYVGNGFGKLIGITQINELGAIETPIILTNTLSAWTAADALVDYMLSLPDNKDVRSINPVVGETNDGYLNNIRKRSIKKEHVLEALRTASSNKLEEGNVGAGTGTVCFGLKGGIGTSSRVLPEQSGGYTIGVLVQSNFGGFLTINDRYLWKSLETFPFKDLMQQAGSCMIIIATDAPLSSRNLLRLAKRATLALSKTGSFMSNGSGDYAIAFSTNASNRILHTNNSLIEHHDVLSNDAMTPLFEAVIEATEEAIYNSLSTATSMQGYMGHQVEALDLKLLNALKDASKKN
ncbi:MAG: aminopeptidase [Candidatus Fischerbacteria bacterium RBG_13_37_8]|uniref:Aminopeptidase n=1 Tax=Candidatus Fischerbacteria bacterium RBG_13_37_8 TaxID=1817863 RepID=A0A1F5VM97_9BACT|nr:MAG: aminopeptidase [Candidatus Fischerbacteria bacterium RBG_13_37_8]